VYLKSSPAMAPHSDRKLRYDWRRSPFHTASTPKPSSNHADKLAALIVTRSFPW